MRDVLFWCEFCMLCDIFSGFVSVIYVRSQLQLLQIKPSDRNNFELSQPLLISSPSCDSIFTVLEQVVELESCGS